MLATYSAYSEWHFKKLFETYDAHFPESDWRNGKEPTEYLCRSIVRTVKWRYSISGVTSEDIWLAFVTWLIITIISRGHGSLYLSPVSEQCKRSQ